MTIKTTLTAAVLALAPTFALAEGCNWGSYTTKEETVSTCAPGQALDSATGLCVDASTS